MEENHGEERQDHPEATRLTIQLVPETDSALTLNSLNSSMETTAASQQLDTSMYDEDSVLSGPVGKSATMIDVHAAIHPNRPNIYTQPVHPVQDEDPTAVVVYSFRRANYFQSVSTV